MYRKTLGGTIGALIHNRQPVSLRGYLDANPALVARAYAPLSVSQHEDLLACWDAKCTYSAIRPSQLDPTLTMVFPTPNHPTVRSRVRSSVLGPSRRGYLFPDQAEAITSAGVSPRVLAVGWRHTIAPSWRRDLRSDVPWDNW
jgi:hypothetical protein